MHLFKKFGTPLQKSLSVFASLSPRVVVCSRVTTTRGLNCVQSLLKERGDLSGDLMVNFYSSWTIRLSTYYL